MNLLPFFILAIFFKYTNRDTSSSIFTKILDTDDQKLENIMDNSGTIISGIKVQPFDLNDKINKI